MGLAAVPEQRPAWETLTPVPVYRAVRRSAVCSRGGTSTAVLFWCWGGTGLKQQSPELSAEPWERQYCCLSSCLQACSWHCSGLMGTASAHTMGSARAAPRRSLCSHLCFWGCTELRHWDFIICFWEEQTEAGICVGSRATAEQYVWMNLIAIGEILGISCTCSDSGLVRFGGHCVVLSL